MTMCLPFDRIAEHIAAREMPLLVGIDGLPASGRTTLVEHLMDTLDAECLWLDEFLRPESEWPVRDRPSFPFNYMRYDDFMNAVRTLARDRQCSYHPYDWATGRYQTDIRTIRLTGLTIVEGVSALHPDLAPLYDLRIWVESDPATALAASVQRGGGVWAREWNMMFMPSAGMYLQTHPEHRADLIACGRGIEPG